MGKIYLNDETYGGDVVANPQETPTDDLESIKIDDIVYGFASGGNYTRTVLYDNQITSTGQIQLSDDITNYDDLEFIVQSRSDGASNPFRIAVETFLNIYVYTSSYSGSNLTTFMSMYGSGWYCRVTLGEDTTKLWIRAISNEKVIKIYGIKY